MFGYSFSSWMRGRHFAARVTWSKPRPNSSPWRLRGTLGSYSSYAPASARGCRDTFTRPTTFFSIAVRQLASFGNIKRCCRVLGCAASSQRAGVVR